MKRLFIVIFLTSTVLAGLCLHSWKTTSAAILPMHHRNSFCGTWTVVPSPNAGSSTNFLNAVAATGTGNAWAVGSYGNSNGSFPLIEHWSNSQWTVIPGPSIPGSLAGITAIAANNIWAVGENDSSNRQQTLVEHWNGTQWSVVNSPSPGSIASDLVAAAGVPQTNHFWAVGSTNDGVTYQTLVEKC